MGMQHTPFQLATHACLLACHRNSQQLRTNARHPLPPPPCRSNNSLQSSTMAAPLRAVSPAGCPLPAPTASPYPAFPAAQPAVHPLQGMPLTLPGVPLSYVQAQQLVSPLPGIPPRHPLPPDASLSALTALLYSPRQPEPAAAPAYRPDPAAAPAGGQQLGGTALFSMPSWGALANAPSLALQPSTDLGALFGPADLPMPDVEPLSKQESGTGDDWLSWDGWQVGAGAARLAGGVCGAGLWG